MGSLRGFLEIPRSPESRRPVPSRIGDYEEYLIAPEPRELQRQGARCMDCGIPYCQSSYGCPVANLIPEWNDLVYRGDWSGALARLERTNNLPEVTGRVCPAPCETACTLSINDAPVTIKRIELAVAERGFAAAGIVPHPPARESGRHVAVIGSGPAGLSCAQQLRRVGHSVTVFERSNLPGGLLRYGIPDFKLSKRVVDRRLDQIRREGVVFECGVSIGEDVSPSYLRRSHHAVVLAMGAGAPRELDVPGRELEGIVQAMDFLSTSNRRVAGDTGGSDSLSAQGREVLVIGGGDTGSDCVGTAIRQGARRVTQVEILPEPPRWESPWNPRWPHWPSILRTSSSHEEGCERRWSVATIAFESSGARVERAVCRDAPGSGPSYTIDADLVLLAMGFLHVSHSGLLQELGVELDERGNILVGQGFPSPHATSVHGVFSAGDAHSGASLVVRAVDHGRRAASEVAEFLAG